MSTLDGEYLRALGRRVVDARKLRGWNQLALARESGMSDATVRKIEKGIEVSPAYLRIVTDTVGLPPPGEDPEMVFAPDVQGVIRLIGMHLSGMGPDERMKVINELTKFLVARWKATHSE